MNRRVGITTIALALISVVGVAAQTTTADPQAAPPSHLSTGTITITGCLQSTDPSMSNTSGSMSAARNSSGAYQLTGAMMGSKTSGVNRIGMTDALLEQYLGEKRGGRR
jgi:hypothetical protein